MSDDLLAVADRVVAMAAPGEQVEAVVVRGLDTEIKVYGGEVESLSSAQSQGVGIRVVVDGRQGFAYAGSLDEGVIAETLAEVLPTVGEPPALILQVDDGSGAPLLPGALDYESALAGADPDLPADVDAVEEGVFGP